MLTQVESAMAHATVQFSVRVHTNGEPINHNRGRGNSIVAGASGGGERATVRDKNTGGGGLEGGGLEGGGLLGDDDSMYGDYDFDFDYDYGDGDGGGDSGNDGGNSDGVGGGHVCAGDADTIHVFVMSCRSVQVCA
jgi:hypothetical protein